MKRMDLKSGMLPIFWVYWSIGIRNRYQVSTLERAVGQFNYGLAYVCDKIAARHHVWLNIQFILEILFCLAHGIVAVQLFRIRILREGINEFAVAGGNSELPFGLLIFL